MSSVKLSFVGHVSTTDLGAAKNKVHFLEDKRLVSREVRPVGGENEILEIEERLSNPTHLFGSDFLLRRAGRYGSAYSIGYPPCGEEQVLWRNGVILGCPP